MIGRAIPAALALTLAACASTPAPAPIPDTTARVAQLSTLNRLVREAGLAGTLSAAGPYTVFAPSDEAFKAMPAKTMQQLGSDPVLLKELLTYHVVAGRITAAQAVTSKAKTVQGSEVAIARSGSFVTVEDALVTQPDLVASNGVVHVIDRVLMPPKK
jgi:uncharacterized surface protein with fasciclin (FAS1) repeats